MKELHGIKVPEKVGYNKLKAGEHKRINPVGFKGYPGLTHTAKPISHYIPKCKIFVEPFAGLGRISKHVKADHYVLNDLSDYAIKYLRKHFKKAYIMQEDYLNCMWLFDSKATFFFCDPVWIDPMYEENPLCANPRPNRIVYNELLELVPKLQGDWMIAGKVDGPLSKWPTTYYHKEIQSKDKKLFGLKARTYLVSNKPFTNYWQMTLGAF